jgi:hypothetical protein
MHQQRTGGQTLRHMQQQQQQHRLLFPLPLSILYSLPCCSHFCCNAAALHFVCGTQHSTKWAQSDIVHH